MACTSGSVQKVADKTVTAKEQIDKLQAMIEAQAVDNKTKFYNEIIGHLGDASVKDAIELSYNSSIKTEYTSEFSLDKIAAVVTSALKAVAAAQDPTAQSPAMSNDAIAAYADLVNRVAEAAKSSSTSSASLSFSMNRISPGLFAFLYASAVTIRDEDTFGTEAVTMTCIYYRFMQSIDDVKNNVDFSLAVIDARNLLAFKTLQAGLTEMLADGKINLDEWIKKDAMYSKVIKNLKARLDANQFDPANPIELTVKDGFGAPFMHSFATGSAVDQNVVQSAIQKISAMGESYKVVVDTSNARLANAYY